MEGEMWGWTGWVLGVISGVLAGRWEDLGAVLGWYVIVRIRIFGIRGFSGFGGPVI